MKIQRVASPSCRPPFPVYSDLVDALTGAHQEGTTKREPTVAHVLGTCAGYSYGDTETVATMMARLGLDAQACVSVSQTVDAMFIFSTAYLIQSRCGRVVILSYRGTEPTSLGNWLGDADVGSEASLLSAGDGVPPVRVHAGFHLNVRATWFGVIDELTHALSGKSLLDPERDVENPLDSLYVTGHSLGGAMAVVFALAVAGDDKYRAIAERLRAIYTFGQPMAVCAPVPPWVDRVGQKLLRHVRARDPVPSLPPVQWGPFAHIGQEFRFQDGEWRRPESPTGPLVRKRDVARAVLALVAPEKQRQSFRYSAAEHRPHHYIAELRPRDRVSELGD
ncbi:MAG TPA: lipase family protein [Anaeromyxobacteraceae bacterium]|nr:lipase family protein [Anaeromyxobacteraceae bacterium]